MTSNLVSGWLDDAEGSAEDGIGYSGEIPVNVYQDIGAVLNKHGLLQRGAALKSPAHLLRLATNAFEASAAAVAHGDAAGGDTNKQEIALRAELEQRQLEPISSPVPGPGEPSHSSSSIMLNANVLCVKAVIAAQDTLCCAGLADGSLVIAGTRPETDKGDGIPLSKWSVKQTAHANNAGGILCIDCRQTSISTIQIACGTMVLDTVVGVRILTKI